MLEQAAAMKFETDECRVEISRVGTSRVLVVLHGRDRGSLGRVPFLQLEKLLAEQETLELFFDLHEAEGATLEVSGSWAVWLRNNKSRLAHVSMLTGTPYVTLSAKTVQRFSELGERLRLYTDQGAFTAALHADG